MTPSPSARNEFDEGVTTARLPASVTERPRIEVTSIEGQVDVAIDTDERAIETPEETFHVLHDGYVYVYEPPVAADIEDLLAPQGGTANGHPPEQVTGELDEPPTED